MKTSKKIALFLGVATGAAVAMMTISKTSKNLRNTATRSVSKSSDKKIIGTLDDTEVNYI